MKRLLLKFLLILTLLPLPGYGQTDPNPGMTGSALGRVLVRKQTAAEMRALLDLLDSITLTNVIYGTVSNSVGGIITNIVNQTVTNLVQIAAETNIIHNAAGDGIIIVTNSPTLNTFKVGQNQTNLNIFYSEWPSVAGIVMGEINSGVAFFTTTNGTLSGTNVLYLDIAGNALFSQNVTVGGNLLANGSALTNLNGTNIALGTISSNRLNFAIGGGTTYTFANSTNAAGKVVTNGTTVTVGTNLPFSDYAWTNYVFFPDGSQAVDANQDHVLAVGIPSDSVGVEFRPAVTALGVSNTFNLVWSGYYPATGTDFRSADFLKVSAKAMPNYYGEPAVPTYYAPTLDIGDPNPYLTQTDLRSQVNIWGGHPNWDKTHFTTSINLYGDVGVFGKLNPWGGMAAQMVAGQTNNLIEALNATSNTVFAVATNGTVYGNGSGLTNLSASQLLSGTVPIGRLTTNTPSTAGGQLMQVAGTDRYWSSNVWVSGNITNSGITTVSNDITLYGAGSDILMNGGNITGAGSVSIVGSGSLSANVANLASWARIGTKIYLASGGDATSPELQLSGPNAALTNIAFYGDTTFVKSSTNASLQHRPGNPPAIALVNMTNGPANLIVGGGITTTNGGITNLSSQPMVTQGGFVSTNTSTFNTVIITNGSVTASNLISGSYGSLALNGNPVTITVNAATNMLTNSWTYSKTFGSIGVVTNTSLIVTNAGDYRISFGAGIASASNGGTMSFHLLTNDVPTGIIWIEASGNTVYETGFKEVVITLPALCRVSVAGGQDGNRNVLVKNACLNVKGAN